MATDKYIEQQQVGEQWIAISWQGIDKTATAFRVVNSDGIQFGPVHADRRAMLSALSDLKFADQYGFAALAKRRAISDAAVRKSTAVRPTTAHSFDRLYNEGGDGYNPHRK